MLSYWEQQSFIKYDHIIIGAGIVGLSLAIELAEANSEKRILVLERGLLPTGASTKNAGFACMGSVGELVDDLTHMKEADVIQLFRQRKNGLEILRKRLGDTTIEYKEEGSYELLSEREIFILDKIDTINRLLKPLGAKPFFSIANKTPASFGFSSHIKAMIENNYEGSIHTGKMMRALMELALSKKIEIKTGAFVKHFEEKENHIHLSIHSGFDNIQLQAQTLSICTNAFTSFLLPDIKQVPGRGQVLITKPIRNLSFKGIYHFDKGYYYFREIDGRVLFGGGRNLDIMKEQTTEAELNDCIQQDLEQKLKMIIVPGTAVEIEYRWAGIMAFGNSKQPIVEQYSNRIFLATRLGGMGVALGSKIAKDLKNIILA